MYEYIEKLFIFVQKNNQYHITLKTTDLMHLFNLLCSGTIL